MLFAVVDIETTGGYASANCITEIAIVVHDGKEVVDYYETLINPHQPIPFFIQKLTGINDEMVATAPSFGDVAGKIYEMLEDKVFVAHNVNFDYSFVKHQLDLAGYELYARKLCTVRYARKVLPGMNGYSLGKLTAQLGINHGVAHRAGGDALATADLLKILVEKDTEGAMAQMLKLKNGEHYLPPNVKMEQVAALPETPGVYYFYNAAGKIIYVGKAVNIKQRVKSHFSNNKITRQKQDFLKDTRSISYKKCGTELMAHILESAEIRRIWPVHNRSQKGYLPQFGLVLYEDRQGFQRFAIEKLKATIKPVFKFNTLIEGQNLLKELIRDYELCNRLCNLSSGCACEQHVLVDEYNTRVGRALKKLQQMLPTFALIDEGREQEEMSCILVKEGIFVGMGYLPHSPVDVLTFDHLETVIEPLQDNDFIRNLVFRYAADNPDKCIELS